MNTTGGVCVLLLGSWCAFACGGSVASGGSNSASAGRGPVGGAGSVADGGANGLSGAGGSVLSGSAGSDGASGGSLGVDLTACSSDSECELVPIDCCATCAVGFEHLRAINAKYDAQYASRCQSVECTRRPCFVLFDSQTNYYIASCQAQRCVALDLRTTALISCNTDADCVLRAGTACCADCGFRNGGPIVALAIGAEPALRGFVCGSAAQTCPACTASFPDDIAVCGDDQKCRIMQSQ